MLCKGAPRYGSDYIVMVDALKRPPSYVVGPDGSPLALPDVPPTNAGRWGIHKKAIIVSAVRGGLLSIEEACQRYSLSVEEFAGWQRTIDQFGLRGLRVTKLREYRTPDAPVPRADYGDATGGA